jgi:hypothetical protein
VLSRFRVQGFKSLLDVEIEQRAVSRGKGLRHFVEEMRSSLQNLL